MPPIAFLAMVLLDKVLLDVVPPTASPGPSVDPTAGSHGFVVYIVGGFFALGLLVLIILLFSRRPKTVRR